jgi:hypothetical protein
MVGQVDDKVGYSRVAECGQMAWTLSVETVPRIGEGLTRLDSKTAQIRGTTNLIDAASKGFSLHSSSEPALFTDCVHCFLRLRDVLVFDYSSDQVTPCAVASEARVVSPEV